MSKPIIRAENLSKRYLIRHKAEGQRYRALRDTLSDGVRSVASRLRGRRRPGGFEEFWALRDVSFEIQPGEVVGIIGRNGAGKSTLLKVLSRITEPTAGRVTLNGRVASLLEVGTGFHPELTGRENIYLNGSILGMSRREIAAKFGEIVAFAEVEKFLDTPVKRYSSGMYVRLAFAVAAHLEPEILIVDEVLAVGDAAFQKKCMGRMGEVAKGGRTVLFVSHNMGAVARLCGRSLWLEQGRMVREGPTEEVVADYLQYGTSLSGDRRWAFPERLPGSEGVHLTRIRLTDAADRVATSFDGRHPFHIEMEVEVAAEVPNFRLSVRVVCDDGVTVFTSMDQDEPWRQSQTCPAGRYTARCVVPGDLLNTGRYTVSVGADVPFLKVLFFEEGSVGFDVEQTGGVTARYPERWPGVICPRLEWHHVTRDGRAPLIMADQCL